MSHTPTPWEHDKQSDCILDGEGRVIVSSYESEHNLENDTANAAFIVKACNSHDDLVAALNSIAHTFMENSQGGLSTLPAGEYQRMAREALTRAGLL